MIRTISVKIYKVVSNLTKIPKSFHKILNKSLFQTQKAQKQKLSAIKFNKKFSKFTNQDRKSKL